MTAEIDTHDFATALAALDEACEELCRLYARSGFVVIGLVLELLTTVRIALGWQEED